MIKIQLNYHFQSHLKKENQTFFERWKTNENRLILFMDKENLI